MGPRYVWIDLRSEGERIDGDQAVSYALEAIARDDAGWLRPGAGSVVAVAGPWHPSL